MDGAAQDKSGHGWTEAGTVVQDWTKPDIPGQASRHNWTGLDLGWGREDECTNVVIVARVVALDKIGHNWTWTGIAALDRTGPGWTWWAGWAEILVPLDNAGPFCSGMLTCSLMSGMCCEGEALGWWCVWVSQGPLLGV